MSSNKIDSRRQCLALLCLAAASPLRRLAGADKPARQPASARLSASEFRIISTLPTVPGGFNAAYTLAKTPARKILTDYSYAVKAPRLKASDWILFSAYPPDHPSQTIQRVTSSPAGSRVTDLSVLQQPLLRARESVKGGKHQQGISLRVVIEADLFARRLVQRKEGDRQPKPTPLTESERQLALRPSSNFEYTNSAVQKWRDGLGLLRGEQEGEVDFARRVFQSIATRFAYEYTGTGQVRTASHVCTKAKSDCCGLAILFVTILRSQGIPARLLCGRWAMPAKPGERIGSVAYYQEHVKAEFFAQEVGWVPVDLSSAILHDRSPAKLEYFGRDRGDFLTLHLDHALEFDTLHFGKQEMELLQKTCYWATGSGDFKDSSITESWNVMDRA